VNNGGKMPITSPPTIKPEFPFPCSQSLVSGSYHEPDESSPYTPTLSLRSIVQDGFLRGLDEVFALRGSKQHVLVMVYGRFGTACVSFLQSLNIPMDCLNLAGELDGLLQF
jgi:hypothetical protein